MKLLLLAAGFGTRLYPLTRDRAKALLEVEGEPVLTRLVRRCAATGAFDAAAVIVNEKFRADFEAWAPGPAPGLPVTVVPNGAGNDQEARGALADLALLLETAVPEGDPEGFLVANADNWLGFEIGACVQRFRSLRAPLLLTRRVPEPVPPSTYNELEVNAAGRVLSFREKPPDPRGNLASVGLYFLPSELPALLARYLAEGGNRDAPGWFIQWLVGQRPVHAMPVPGEWRDAGTRQAPPG